VQQPRWGQPLGSSLEQSTNAQQPQQAIANGGYEPNTANGGYQPNSPTMAAPRPTMAQRIMAQRMMSNVTGVPMGLYPGASTGSQLGSIVNGLMHPQLGGMVMGEPMMGDNNGGGMGGSMSNLLRNFGL
jgi:hypothetical protein